MEIVCRECAGYTKIPVPTIMVSDCDQCYNVGGTITKTCTSCNGTGRKSYTIYQLVTCPTCNGKGVQLI